MSSKRLFKTHTFSYRGKKYYVKDLIEYVQLNNISLTEQPIKEFRIFFNKKNMCEIWRLTDGKILDHYRRIEKANLAYPIIFIRNEKGDIDRILDGWHRLIRSILDNSIIIKAYELKIDDMKNFIKLYEPVSV